MEIKYEDLIEKVAGEIAAEDKTRFWRDRYIPNLKEALISYPASLAGQSIGGYTGSAVGVGAASSAVRAQRLRKLMTQELGREPTKKEYAKALGTIAGSTGAGLTAVQLMRQGFQEGNNKKLGAGAVLSLGGLGTFANTPEAIVKAEKRRLAKERAAEKAASYFEEAQMLKQAAEEAFSEAQLYEDAAIEVLAELGYFEGEE